MQARLLTLLFVFLSYHATAQDTRRLDSFNIKINSAPNDAEKIELLGQLAEYYSVYKLEALADSILQKALFIAEVSNDKKLVLKTLFNNTVTNLGSWSSQESFDRSVHFIKKALRYAQDINNEDYIAVAYMRLGRLYRKRNLYEQAMAQVTQAVTALANTRNDSLKGVLFNELGDIYFSQSNAVAASKNYNKAFLIAYDKKIVPLQSETYHRLSELYKTLNDSGKAKEYLLQSLDMNIKNKNQEGQFKNYMGLARLTSNREYIDKAHAMADNLNSDRYKISAKRLMFYLYMVQGKNSNQTFNYLYSNPELVDCFKNAGLATYHWEIGNIFRYSNQYDSALVYYQMAESELPSSKSQGLELDIYSVMAETFLYNKDSANAEIYFKKSFELCKQMNELNLLQSISDQLGWIYESNGDLRQAIYYTRQSDSVNKLVQVNAAKDKVVLLQIERENKKMESDLAEAALKKERKNNLQIMIITLAITGFFTLMLFIGMFNVSKTTIKLLGYFAFISLFEFIILLLDHPIVSFTDGEPVKIWLIKICLIALLVPCQHFLERKLIQFLESRSLMKARKNFSLKKWLYGLKIPAPKNAGVQNDETVI